MTDIVTFATKFASDLNAEANAYLQQSQSLQLTDPATADRLKTQAEVLLLVALKAREAVGLF